MGDVEGRFNPYIHYLSFINNTILNFFYFPHHRCQGGMVSTILAHELLDVSDYSFYLNTMMKTPKEIDGEECSKHVIKSTGFEMKSRKAWTDLLLQVVKVKVHGSTRKSILYAREIF